MTAEEFILEHVRHCSTEITGWDKNGLPIHQPWITPDNALKAVEMARESMLKEFKPKFHKGEWIIHQGTENIYQVVAVIDNQYQLKYGDNYTVQKCADVDRCARLWDITKDAKVGDVLVNGPILIIVDHLGTFENRPIIYSWYFADSKKFHGIGPTEPDRWEAKGFIPATKKQRDLLFQKMKEAGYEWDADKLQLKKIEQKPAFDIEIPFGIDSGLIEKFITIPEGCYAVIEGNQVVIRKGEKPAIKLERDENGEPILTPFEAELFSMMSDAWQGYQLGEEVNIVEIVKEHSSELLERANKQKPAWSEEDEEILNLIIARLHSHPNVDLEEYSKEYDWLNYTLKSLRPQSHWKPSEEQMKALNTCLVEGQINHVGQGEKLQSLYNELKILK